MSIKATQPEDSAERTPKDYAIEHAEYMATTAEHLLEALNAEDAIRQRREESDDVDEDDVYDAGASRSEFVGTLRKRIYEFRKRRDRALATPSPQPAEARLQAECDAITELNHRQWLSLENVRLLAARHRKEEWAQHMLRFCEEAGATASPLRSQPAEAKTAAVDGMTDAKRYRLLRRGQKWSVINGIGEALRAEDLDAAIDAAIATQEAAKQVLQNPALERMARIDDERESSRDA